jgi:hypothetical protein
MLSLRSIVAALAPQSDAEVAATIWGRIPEGAAPHWAISGSFAGFDHRGWTYAGRPYFWLGADAERV